MSDTTLLSVARDVEKLGRREYEDLLVELGLYSLDELHAEGREYSGLSSKHDLIMRTFQETGGSRILEELHKRNVLNEESIRALATDGIEFEHLLTTTDQATASMGPAATGMSEQFASHGKAIATVPEKDLASLQRRLAEARDNLRLIQERKTEFVLGTDIPLQLVREERRVRHLIAELEQQLAARPVEDDKGSTPSSDQKGRGIDKTQVIVAVIAAIAAIMGAYWQFVWKPSQQSSTPTPIPQQLEYVGRVLDAETGAPIRGAKVTLDFHGAPPIVYTDTEGIYRFVVTIGSDKLLGRVRIEANGYEDYDRNISLTLNTLNIEDIRLKPLASLSPTVTPIPPTVTPSPTNTATSTSVSKAKVIGTVNVRVGPAIDYRILGQVEVGYTSEIYGRNNNADWVLIDYLGQQGWVSVKYTQIEGDISEVPIKQVAPPVINTPTPQPIVQLTAFVDARMNIYGAGKLVLPPSKEGKEGLPPEEVDFLAQPGQTLTISKVEGAVNGYGGGCLSSGADGGPSCTGKTYISSYGGLSGIQHISKTMFLVGVFLDNTEPADPAPPTLTFTERTENFESISPLLNQVFFIGDGRTENGTIQRFEIPETATRLYLGFAESFNFGYPDNPGLPDYYSDNTGGLTVLLSIQIAPKPNN